MLVEITIAAFCEISLKYFPKVGKSCIERILLTQTDKIILYTCVWMKNLIKYNKMSLCSKFYSVLLYLIYEYRIIT